MVQVKMAHVVKLALVCSAILAIFKTYKETLSTAQPVLTKRPLALGNSWC